MSSILSVRGIPEALADLGVINPYHYTPTTWACALFVALFGLSTIIHFAQVLQFRTWWLIPTVCIAGVVEILGWSARLWSSKNLTNITPFLMQYITTMVAPTTFVAANFIIFGNLVTRLGPKFSRISGQWYLVIFTLSDVISIVVQFVGGAKTSLAVSNNQSPNTGGNIMFAGITFQLAMITIYMLLVSEFVVRFLYNRPLRKGYGPQYDGTHYLDTRMKFLFAGLSLSSVAIYIRSIYRTIELASGWNGPIISTQKYFNILDGGMVVAAMYSLNIFHPGYLVTDAPKHRRSDNRDCDATLKETETVESITTPSFLV